MSGYPHREQLYFPAFAGYNQNPPNQTPPQPQNQPYQSSIHPPNRPSQPSFYPYPQQQYPTCLHPNQQPYPSQPPYSAQAGWSNQPGFNAGGHSFVPQVFNQGYGVQPIPINHNPLPLPPIHLGLGMPSSVTQTQYSQRSTSSFVRPVVSTSRLRNVKSSSNLNPNAPSFRPSMAKNETHALPPRPSFSTSLPPFAQIQERQWSESEHSFGSSGGGRSSIAGFSRRSNNKMIRANIKRKRETGEQLTTQEAKQVQRQADRRERRAQERKSAGEEACQKPSNASTSNRSGTGTGDAALQYSPVPPPKIHIEEEKSTRSEASPPAIDPVPPASHRPSRTSGSSPPHEPTPPLQGPGNFLELDSHVGSGDEVHMRTPSPTTPKQVPLSRYGQGSVLLPGAPFPPERFGFPQRLTTLHPCPPWKELPPFPWLDPDFFAEPERDLSENSHRSPPIIQKQPSISPPDQESSQARSASPSLSGSTSPQVNPRARKSFKKLLPSSDNEDVFTLKNKKVAKGDDSRSNRDRAESGLMNQAEVLSSHSFSRSSQHAQAVDRTSPDSSPTPQPRLPKTAKGKSKPSLATETMPTRRRSTRVPKPVDRLISETRPDWFSEADEEEKTMKRLDRQAARGKARGRGKR